MATFQGLFFLVLETGLLVVDYRSLSRGWLPCGPNGLKGRLEFRRAGPPLHFWLMFTVYGAAGVYLIVFATRVLLGSVEPLPLR